MFSELRLEKLQDDYDLAGFDSLQQIKQLYGIY